MKVRWKNVLLIIPRALFLLPAIPRDLWVHGVDGEQHR
jgi:hypothetical protein